jgi:hypothetical protein
MYARGRLRYLIMGAVLLAGCYEEIGGPGPTIFGRYSLRSVDGEAVPVIMSEVPNFKLEIMTGTILLNNDNTFTDSTEMRRTDGQVARIVTDVAHGNFVRTGDVIDLSSTRGEHYSMTIAQRTLTQNLGGSILVYRK